MNLKTTFKYRLKKLFGGQMTFYSLERMSKRKQHDTLFFKCSVLYLKRYWLFVSTRFKCQRKHTKMENELTEASQMPADGGMK